jgi:hypothetical protein
MGMTRRLPGLLLALCALTIAGCSVPPAQRAPLATTSSWPEPKPTKPYTVEELGAAVGCTPVFQGKAADFRQANCKVDDTDYLLLDFATDKGQKDWFEYAILYGGSYLVGERWILTSSSEEAMLDLQDELGGRIEQDETMGGGHGMDMGGA